jgi:hypothetical protein
VYRLRAGSARGNVRCVASQSRYHVSARGNARTNDEDDDDDIDDGEKHVYKCKQ